MITEDLIAYIQSQIKKNFSRDEIASKLKETGWHDEDIKEALDKIITTAPIPAPIPDIPINKEETKKEFDPYRELPEIAPVDVSTPITGKTESPKIEVQKTESPKVWTPMAVKSEPDKVIPIKKITESSPIMKNDMEVRNEEISAPKIIPETPLAIIPPVIPATPAINIKPAMPEVPIKSEAPIIIDQSKSPKTSITDNLPKSAMTSSYMQDVLSANKVEEKPHQSKKALIKWLVIAVAIVIIGGMFFVLAEGYIKIPVFKINLLLIKKDPKSLLLNNTATLRSLKSYKIETIATISSPSFANITSGLISGEAVTSTDRDFISINSKGLINQSGLPLPLSNYDISINGSVFKSDIAANIKYDGKTLFVNVPDLSQILNGNSPMSGVVAIPNGELGLITDLFPNAIKDKIKKIDIYKVLSSSMASGAENITNAALKDFTSNTSFIEKNGEDINGASTYHYEINADKPTTKKFLTALSGIFAINLSDNNKANLDNIFGSASIDSFEVWIGKNDNNIHRYKFTLSVPLSKVIGLNDEGIADNEVKLDWQTTYYDFDVANSITMPENTISMADFIKSVNDMKIKNTILSFSSAAKNLFNAYGSYGKRSNLTGNCANPNSGSLFSPLGYPKSASTQVGNIASIMNSLLDKTGNEESCYSTSRAWALSATLSDSKSFCADSTGASKIIDAKLSSTVCK
jgi:hypothetical protein